MSEGSKSVSTPTGLTVMDFSERRKTTLGSQLCYTGRARFPFRAVASPKGASPFSPVELRLRGFFLAG